MVGRLRRGENVDVNAEAPPLRVGRDEIGRVGQAFDLVRQTAIRAAVEEARLRQGLNDVFRSLARRSQSLLHRQLTLLDQMERRASDPEALDDLFRLDHLTTRMRRHAEGLVILAGAPPGRGWSSPVRMVDVMRGAIAEVEDYARVSVATRSQAALTGSAVADVIHLLAELIENATTLSPPYTSVRVSGDTVANGFAIEVEDRGLGIGPTRLAELNDRLANPPEFNPSDSEQLGLFVVSQLAKRHGIRVTLKASPYGGTAAIVLIPRHLVVTEEAFRSGLPGEPAMAQLIANGNSGLDASSTACPDSASRRGSASPGRCAGRRGSSRSGLNAARTPRPTRARRGERAAQRGGRPAQAPRPAGGRAARRRTAARCRSAGAGTVPRLDPAQHAGRIRRAGPRRLARPGRAATPMTPMTPVASPPPGRPPGRRGSSPARPDRFPRRRVRPDPRRLAGLPGPADRTGRGPTATFKDLPRRVRQANLAPQLRDNPPPRRTTLASSGPRRAWRARVRRGLAGPSAGTLGTLGTEPGGDPPDHVGAAARLAGRPVATAGRAGRG